MNIIKKRAILMPIIFLGLCSLAALICAYIAQYFFNLQPCQLCLYQRWPYFLIISLSLIALLVTNNKLLLILLSIILIALYSGAILAFYHVSVEFKIFKGFGGCSGNNLNNITDLAQLKIAINNQPLLKCDEPQFYFLGLTMAFWNMLYSLFLAIFGSYLTANYSLCLKNIK